MILTAVLKQATFVFFKGESMRRIVVLAGYLCAFTLLFSSCAGTKAQTAVSMKPGVYTVTQRGFAADFTITVEVNEHRIVHIDVVSTQDTAGIGERAQKLLARSVVENQSTNVDTLSGATISSLTMLNAVRNGLSQAGANGNMFSENKKSAPPIHVKGDIESYRPDVLVVGGGLAGIMAAMTIAGEGGRALLFEQNSFFGGSTLYSGAALAQAGSDIQAARFPQTTADTLAAWLKESNAEVEGFNPVLAETLAKQSSSAANQLIQWGLKIGSMVPFGNGAGITLNVDSGEFAGRGLDIFQQIMGRFNDFVEQGNIAYLLNTKVTELITDNSGAVTGVRAENKQTGTSTEYRAKATILASGGFADNREILDTMYTRYGSSSGGFSIGNMFAAAKAAGAQNYRMDATRFDGGMLPLAGRNGAMVEMEMKISTPGFVWLNKDGRRVENENGSDTFKRWDAWRYAKDNTIYVLLDQSMVDKNEVFYIGNYATFVSDTGNKRFYELLNAGRYIWKGNTIEEVAQKAGLNAQAVARTITAYNQYCRDGRDPDFGRAAAGLIELKPPFYIAETIASVKGSLGGLVINPNTQVLNTGGNPIPGLYAAGEIVGNIGSTGQSWFGGVCLILGAGYGQIAGQNALAAARGR